ncbi:OmpH family outer membrane protein [Cytophagaceae bacterium ABcell3]|nr:OmpH family outer membrane protein [Cytophagaceae bacterium ABcell3]
MKNLSLALNGVLALAVAVLYYLHFSSSPKPSAQQTAVKEEAPAIAVADTLSADREDQAEGGDEEQPTKKPAMPAIPGLNVAYINLDELTKKYEFYQKSIKSLEAQLKSKEKEYKDREKKFYEDVQKYQQMAASLTDNHKQSKEADLMQEEQELMKLREKLQGDLANQEMQFQQDFLKNLDDYLGNLGRSKKYSYIFTYTKGGPASLVYATDSLDITTEVVNGLNAKYRGGK